MKKQDENMLMLMELGITNTRSVASIGDAMLPYGYGKERLDEGSLLHADARRLDALQQKETGEQRQATNDLNMAIDEANGEYIKHVKLARIALPKDAAAFGALQLGGDRKKDNVGCIAQIGNFYTNMLGNPVWMDAMAGFGVKKEELEKGMLMHGQMQHAYSVQAKEMGEAHNATVMRDAAIGEAHIWYSTFVKVARIALDGQPKLLEILGIRAR